MSCIEGAKKAKELCRDELDQAALSPSANADLGSAMPDSVSRPVQYG